MTIADEWRKIPIGYLAQVMSSQWLRAGHALRTGELGRWIRTSDEQWHLDRNNDGRLSMSRNTFVWNDREVQDFVVVSIAASLASSDEFFRELCGPRTP